MVYVLVFAIGVRSSAPRGAMKSTNDYYTKGRLLLQLGFKGKPSINIRIILLIGLNDVAFRMHFGGIGRGSYGERVPALPFEKEYTTDSQPTLPSPFSPSLCFN